MGRQGDYSKREKKKGRKDIKKLPSVNIIVPPVEVQVIRKGKQRDGRRSDEEE
jgi:hypothetical protein